MAGPLEQFEVKSLVPIEVAGLDLSFTNAALWMTIAAAVSTTFLVAASRRPALVPGRLQTAAEMLYGVVADMVRDNVGSGGRPYFPFIFSMFVLLLFGNLLGLIPGSFTFTSHIVVNFALASFIFVGVTILGFVKHGAGYLRLFLPEGVPLWLSPLMISIELVSYLTRPISLAVRLFANMTVGHVILKIIAGFVISLGVFGVLPFAFLIAIYALEFLVAVLQAYIFTILACIYLNDALHLHH